MNSQGLYDHDTMHFFFDQKHYQQRAIAPTTVRHRDVTLSEHYGGTVPLWKNYLSGGIQCCHLYRLTPHNSYTDVQHPIFLLRTPCMQTTNRKQWGHTWNNESTHARTHPHTNTQTQTHTHAHTKTRTRACTHTHTHTNILICWGVVLCCVVVSALCSGWIRMGVYVHWSIQNKMQILRHNKGPHLNTLKCFHIYAEYLNNNHLNDEHTIFPNIIFATLLKSPPAIHTPLLPTLQSYHTKNSTQDLTQSE